MAWWRAAYRPQHGITLIELLVVMALIGVVGAIMYPKFNHVVDNIRLHNDALQLAQELRAARTEAIMSQQSQDIRFYEEYGYYKMAASSRVVLLSDGISIREASFPYDPLFYVRRCRFRASGSPSQGGHITLINRQGRVKYVIVSAVMGRVRVSTEPPIE